jgi:hypothetical protein
LLPVLLYSKIAPRFEKHIIFFICSSSKRNLKIPVEKKDT